MEADISEADIARAADLPPPAREVAAPPPPPEPRPEPAPQATSEAPSPPDDPFARERSGLIAERKAERERRKKIEADLAARDREMAELRGRFSTFEALMKQAGQPQPQSAETPDPYADPQAYARHQAGHVLDERLNPFAQQQQQFARTLDFNNRMLAGQVHGQDAVKTAEEAFNLAAARGEIDPLEHKRINSSPNPYAAAVDWHKRNETLAKVGPDPEKWFSQSFEERLKGDPAFQKRALELLQGTAQTNEAANGRSAPVFTSLPSVNGAPGASARTGPSSISEADIAAAAPSKMGRRF